MKRTQLTTALFLILAGAILYPCVVFKVVPDFPHSRLVVEGLWCIGGWWVYWIGTKSPRTLMRFFSDADKAPLVLTTQSRRQR